MSLPTTLRERVERCAFLFWPQSKLAVDACLYGASRLFINWPSVTPHQCFKIISGTQAIKLRFKEVYNLLFFLESGEFILI